MTDKASDDKKALANTNVSVLALGNWGTALANHLAKRGHQVIGWTNSQEIADGIVNKHRNPLCFPDLELHSNLKATTDLKEALKSDVLVLAFPSSALHEMAAKMKDVDGKILISALKGLEKETLLTPLQFLREYLGEGPELAVLSGPSFAIDIVQSNPSGVVAAADTEELAMQVADLFSSPAMRIYISTDTIGVELGGISKNVIAIAVGICDGQKLGDSARAGLITRGLAEMMRLAEVMGADPRTLAGLSGLGDLAMTATCDTSRNRKVGLRLGQGEKLDDIVKSLGSVAEGVTTAQHILKLAKKHNVEMPITMGVAMILSGELKLSDTTKYLISRPTRREF